MATPEVLRYLPRRSKKDRNSRVEFLCLHCGEAHIIRLTVFDKITDGIYPCSKRKRDRFEAWVDQQVSELPAHKVEEIKNAVSERRSFGSIAKWLRLPHVAIIHAIIRPRRKPLPPPRPAVECMEQKPVGHLTSEEKAPPASPTPSKQALVEPTSREMIETMKELSTFLTADIKQELCKNIHYEENDEGYKIAHSIKFDKVPMPSSVAAEVKRELIEKGVLTAQCVLINGWREVLH